MSGAYPTRRAFTSCSPAGTPVIAYRPPSSVVALNAKTGAPVWKHQMNGQFWASPLLADGKVYVGSRKAQFCILAAGREKKVLSTIELDGPVNATTTASKGEGERSSSARQGRRA